MLVDEYGFSFLEPLSTTWAPCGHTPVLRRVSKRRRVWSGFVGLTLSGRLLQRLFPESIKGKQVIEGLTYLRRQLGRTFILVWDRSPVHRAKKVQRYLAAHPDIIQEWLPSYAPELNPEEYAHGYVKRRVKNCLSNNEDEMRHLLLTEFARLRHRPDLLLSFFHHAGLTVKQLW